MLEINCCTLFINGLGELRFVIRIAYNCQDHLFVTIIKDGEFAGHMLFLLSSFSFYTTAC